MALMGRYPVFLSRLGCRVRMAIMSAPSQPESSLLSAVKPQ